MRVVVLALNKHLRLSLGSGVASAYCRLGVKVVENTPSSASGWAQIDERPIYQRE